MKGGIRLGGRGGHTPVLPAFPWKLLYGVEVVKHLSCNPIKQLNTVPEVYQHKLQYTSSSDYGAPCPASCTVRFEGMVFLSIE